MRYEIVGRDDTGRAMCFETVADSLKAATDEALSHGVYVESVRELHDDDSVTDTPRFTTVERLLTSGGVG